MLDSDPLMARHRKRPESRHPARRRDGAPAASGAPDRRLGQAMRRVVVTPTFAAGLGVVVAAVLAYPMQTVFSYVAPYAGRPGGLLCAQSGCGHQSRPAGQPSPFGGGVRNPAPSRAAGPGHDPARASPGQPGGGAGQPELRYKIVSRWRGGFWGQITITFPGPAPAKWRLRFGYPAGHIVGINPDSYLQPGGHGAVVRSTDYPGAQGPGGRTFRVGVGVQGEPAAPARCAFDGQACQIR
jgi:Cellulose binding domain